MNGKILSIAIVILLSMVSFGAVGTNLSNDEYETTVNEIGDFAPGEVIVGFYKQIDDLTPIDVRTIDSYEGYEIIQKIENLNAAVVEVPIGSELSFVDSFSTSPYVKAVEPNHYVYATYNPNDPKWGSQWGPKRIYCRETWDSNKGSKSVTIAILDTGVDYNHPDIAGNYVSGGYDFVNDDDDPMDDDDHGTHCAGIAAAVMNNNKGIAGVAQVNIVAEKVLAGDKRGTVSHAAAGIDHAVDVLGADVISMSFTSEEPSIFVQWACDDAYYNHDVILAGAAGNDGNGDWDFPAGHESVIAVGAIDQDDERCSFSNYGSHLELMGPGASIYSTVPGNDYESKSGTSMATPHVAGVAALVYSSKLGISSSQARKLMRETAEDLGDPGKDNYYGYGCVNALVAGGAIMLGKGVVMGNGNEGESYARATCYSVDEVECSPGEKIKFRIDYRLDCWKAWDWGECIGTVDGVTKYIETTSNVDGYWIWEITCKPGDTIDWTITCKLTDWGWEKNGACSGSLTLVEPYSNNPPNKPTITGPTSGGAGTSYTYTFDSTDPDGDQVSYYVDWGDGTNTGWFGPYASGATQTKSHTWSSQRTYTIQAKAKDTNGAESGLSTLSVTMPRNRAVNTPFLNLLQQPLFFLFS